MAIQVFGKDGFAGTDSKVVGLAGGKVPVSRGIEPKAAPGVPATSSEPTALFDNRKPGKNILKTFDKLPNIMYY